MPIEDVDLPSPGVGPEGLPSDGVDQKVVDAVNLVKNLLEDAAYANLYQASVMIPAATYKAIASSMPKQ
ncbi:MAG: hypothetical protein AAF228_05350 [Pseudomonadota bacterium]